MLEKGIYFSGDGTNDAVLRDVYLYNFWFSCVYQFYFDLHKLFEIIFIPKKVSCPCKRGYYFLYLTKCIDRTIVYRSSNFHSMIFFKIVQKSNLIDLPVYFF